ncbi:grasp-with-spasm system ATP-grasp peptide maturase [Chryseobacterium sp. RP-3-3]|uniref:Grasp-with-spasm system ATP-grasp peptide maturase n=1 Tax=Chryseobacterium antibioticum TaxID=2728847 RepID=A0A7Y0FT04_9FLAO|nr:grasp-with-spasm system ATP-grasp peptide maturase [Chryseobacterium antibioticum]NML70979.1 grasp-with-spasm system ATP-grasp peptide maturase [Chryseobacterium antibioticum]
MILILSNNKEADTKSVIRWLLKLNKKFIRVHENEYFEIKIYDRKIFLQSTRNSFFLNEISSIWYRRGGLKFKRLTYMNESVHLHMNETQHWLEDYVLKTLDSKKHINKQLNSQVNKLIVLEKAKEAGLQVPPYYLSENTDGMQLGKTIVKPITGNPNLVNIKENSDGVMYTAVITEYEENFFISFFQKKIKKDFEIRTFYLNGKCWSMSIFSQNDKQTEVDYRKYNDKKPNRNVPYNLPPIIEKKIDHLMKSMDLNCGSIDFIKSGRRYYFLEINPVGQFMHLSNCCNYFLDKKIAEFLS